jgi:hypothetical protein
MTDDLNVSVDVQLLLSSALDRVLGIFGHDSFSRSQRDRIERQIRLSAERASYVHTVGMDRAIPIDRIYQQTRFKDSTNQTVLLEEILSRKEDASILAGAGRGKTTFLHWLFLSLLKAERTHYTPLLITLRESGAVDSLRDIVLGLRETNRLLKKPTKIRLLVDGYDEIPLDKRKVVSELLFEFSAFNLGHYILTCRLFYDLIDLKASRYYIEDFTRQDALSFLKAFAEVYEASFEPEALLDELYTRGFSDFTSSPLLLVLVCILKSGPMRSLPKNTIGLLRRALDTLTLRWDQARGLDRTSTIQLDGEERVRCLMRIAYHTKKLSAQESAVLSLAADHLRLLQRSDVNASALLHEMAQWYGILIPASEAEWTFVHKSLHDFLAARFWVESGRFSPGSLSSWDSRTAYAVCLVPDATTGIVASLAKSPDLNVFVECIYNNALFDPVPVTRALFEHFKAFGHFRITRLERSASAWTEYDLFHLLSSAFLEKLLAHICSQPRAEVREFLTAFALSEIEERGIALEDNIYRSLVSYYGGDAFRFTVESPSGVKKAQLRNLDPRK